jgi:hypothetical protein
MERNGKEWKGKLPPDGFITAELFGGKAEVSIHIFADGSYKWFFQELVDIQLFAFS